MTLSSCRLKALLGVLFWDQRLPLALVPPHSPPQCLLSSAQHDSAFQRRWPFLVYSFSPGQMWTGVRVILTVLQAAWMGYTPQERTWLLAHLEEAASPPDWAEKLEEALRESEANYRLMQQWLDAWGAEHA